MKNDLMPFDFNDHLIRMKLDDQGQPLFVAKDICDVLGLEHITNMLNKLDDDEKLTLKLLNSGQMREMWVVNESGLYTLIIRSNKPEAKEFRKWVTGEVLPSIRKTGGYVLPVQPSPADKKKMRDRALDLYMRGYSISQIAEAMGVNEATVYRWKKQDAKNEITNWDNVMLIMDIPMPALVKSYAFAIKKSLYDFRLDTDKIRDARIADAMTKHIAILKQLAPNGLELLSAENTMAIQEI